MCIFENEGVSLPAKGLFFYLQYLADDDMICRASIQYVVADLLISKPSFRKYILELVEEGYIEEMKSDEDARGKMWRIIV